MNVKLLGRGREEDPDAKLVAEEMERFPEEDPDDRLVTGEVEKFPEEDPDAKVLTGEEEEFPEEGPEYVEVKLFMVVTVDKLTLKVVVQASGSWRLT